MTGIYAAIASHTVVAIVSIVVGVIIGWTCARSW